jgi:hypothetical protein
MFPEFQSGANLGKTLNASIPILYILQISDFAIEGFDPSTDCL